MIEDVLKRLDKINGMVQCLQIDNSVKSEIQGYLRRINDILFNSVFP